MLWLTLTLFKKNLNLIKDFIMVLTIRCLDKNKNLVTTSQTLLSES